MLVKEVISIGTKIRITIPVQRLCASIKTYSTSSGSSSDSSSDSDSDTEHVQKIKKHEPLKTLTDNSVEISKFDILIDKMMQNNNNTNTIDVAIPLKEATRKKKLYTKNNLSYEARLAKAVQNLTNISNKDKEEINLQLSKMSKDHTTNISNQKNFGSAKNLLTNTRVGKPPQSVEKETNSYSMNNISFNETKKGIIHELKAEQDRKKYRNAADMISGSKSSIKEKQSKYHVEKKIRQEPNKITFTTGDYPIFQNIKEHTTTVPDLSVWRSLEQRELSLLSNQSPQNIFQEMIQWTESGKLWTFPIDNEYGMEEEHNVHFSEHVFLERHLKDWCPKRGPVRHFMELVCIGLSKNPYMTVDEKIEHITWYKEYFKGKEELLKELGAIDVSSSMEKQIKS